MPKGSIPRSKSGRTWDYLANRSNIGRPFRAVKALMDDPPSLTGPIRKEDIERSFDAAGLATAGSMAGKRPPNSVGAGGRVAKSPTNKSPAVDLKRGDLRMQALDRAVRGTDKAKAPIGRRARPGEKSFIGPVKKPEPGDKGFIGPSRPPKAGEKGFVGPRRPPKAGESDFIGPVGRPKKFMSGKTKLGIGASVGAGSAAALGYRAANKPNASESKASGSKYSGYGNKTSSSSYGATKKEPSTEPKGDLKAPNINTAAPTAGGANSAKDKMVRQRQGTNPDKKPSVPAKDRSKLSGRTAKQVVQGSAPKRGMTFQEATRRNRSDEYLKERIRPKKNLLDLFKTKR